ncbi:3-hydroxybutyryl-CoA dehydrogenase [bacterium]|nr:3-hydroxybutyryl-CoA dehydrogenase [bacterium]
MLCPRVLVVGAGQMGAGIAQVMAASGREVLLHDAFEGVAAAAKEAVQGRLERSEAKGKLPVGGAAAAVARLTVAESVSMEGIDLAVEAVVEDEAVKREVFAALGAGAKATAILASNTSSIPIAVLAEASGRPGQTIGMHFMNPVPVMELVEVVVGDDTEPAVVAAVEEVARDLGKRTVRSADRPGFISNRILMPMINEAVRALGEGVGSAPDIDLVLTLGMRHPMGPLRLADLIGLDTCLAIMRVLWSRLGGEGYRPAPLLEELVAAGRLGRKSGHGFFRYDRKHR